MTFDASTLFAGLVFSTIGGSVWMYGKRQKSMRPMLLGAALVGVPFLLDGLPLWLSGAALTALVFFPR
jgi:hypothetical protein